jgi:heat shock protein 4
MQVSIVAFKKGQLRVLSHAWDRNLGGRDLDNVLFEYFANEFQERYKLDVRTNLRGSFRLRMACEKVRRKREHVVSFATAQLDCAS